MNDPNKIKQTSLFKNQSQSIPMANILLRSNSITAINSIEQFPPQISSSALLQKGHLSKHSFDNLKLIKINSSLTENNQSLEKFNTNQQHLDPKKMMTENTPVSSDSNSFNGESNSSAFWDSLHKGLSASNLIRNTVSSSNLSTASSASKHYIFTAQQQSKPKELAMYRKNSLPSFNDDNIKNNNNNNESSASLSKSQAKAATTTDIQSQSHKLQSNGGATKCSPHQVMLLYGII